MKKSPAKVTSKLFSNELSEMNGGLFVPMLVVVSVPSLVLVYPSASPLTASSANPKQPVKISKKASISIFKFLIVCIIIPS